MAGAGLEETGSAHLRPNLRSGDVVGARKVANWRSGGDGGDGVEERVRG